MQTSSAAGVRAASRGAQKFNLLASANWMQSRQKTAPCILNAGPVFGPYGNGMGTRTTNRASAVPCKKLFALQVAVTVCCCYSGRMTKLKNAGKFSDPSLFKLERRHSGQDHRAGGYKEQILGVATAT